MLKLSFTAVAAGLLCAASALADDSSAALSAGGLVLTKSTAVRMADENLYISPQKVRIRFVFANDTDRDVETPVAFPLPDIDTNQFTLSQVGTMSADPVNFVDFTVTANGKAVCWSFFADVRSAPGLRWPESMWKGPLALLR